MSKVSLHALKGNSYFATGIFAIGIYQHDNTTILIDSGSDDGHAKNVYDLLQAQGHSVTAIINTHCHPDHCGGNHFFQKKFPDIKIYATRDEKELIENPNLAPRCFCGGAAPFAGLQHKHIAPQKETCVTNVIAPYSDQKLAIGSAEIKIVTLPGHTPGSIGIITPENILYSGDALFGTETFNKHPMLFYTDIENTLASFKKLASLPVDACVLYHGGVIYDLPNVAKQHEMRILEIKEVILSTLQQQQLSIDLLTQKIMQHYKIPDNIIPFVLTQTAVRAYLTKLEQEKAIKLMVQDGLLQAMAII